jgi:hypothetical protein
VKKLKELKSVVFVGCDGEDWEGLYIDGKLYVEGHSISVKDLLDSLDIPYSNVECDDAWLDKKGCLPKLLKDVKEPK